VLNKIIFLLLTIVVPPSSPLRWWVLPSTQRRLRIWLCWWVSRPLGVDACTLCWWVSPPLGGDNASTNLWALSQLAYRQSKSSAVGPTPAWSSYSAAGISPSEPPFDVRWWFTPLHGNTNISLQLPSSYPWADYPW